MDKLVTKMILFIWFTALSTLAIGADNCPVGQRKLNSGEPCIPEGLFTYLYCLSKSGGGRIEIQEKSDKTNTKEIEINVAGKGSGVILSGELGGGFKRGESERATREISERLAPSLAANCKEFVPPPPAQPAKSSSLSPPLGASLYLGMSREDLKRVLPSNAYWTQNTEGVLVTSNGTFLGAPGLMRIVIEADKVKRVSFSSTISGATWTTNYAYKDSQRNRNGEALNHLEAKQECRPILAIQSDLVKEFGAPSRIVRKAAESDPTAGVTKPKTVRVAKSLRWANEYRMGQVSFVVDLSWWDWDYDVQDTVSVSTTKQNFGCHLTVEFS